MNLVFPYNHRGLEVDELTGLNLWLHISSPSLTRRKIQSVNFVPHVQGQVKEGFALAFVTFTSSFLDSVVGDGMALSAIR